MSIEEIKTNCPRDCYDGCGIVVRKEDGVIKQVLGDPDHPVSRGRLCSKCAVAYNGVWQDENARLLYPLKRSGPKGSGQFQRIGWDQAIEEIAGRLTSISTKYGPQSILNIHYSGTLSLIALEFPMRFFNRLGASEVDGATICNAAGHVAWGLLFGESGVGFDPRTVAESECIFVWGANPSHSGPHAHKYWLPESPGKIVVIDPVRTGTAGQADLHLQPFPGTDAALAFSILHELHKQGSFDQDFIDNYTLGADELLPLLGPCTPEWGEQQTGVPAAAIKQAAKWYGTGPALLWVGQALTRQLRGGNIMRAVGLLPALTGNIGKPGAGFYFLNMTPGIAGIDMDRLEGTALFQGEKLMVSHMDFPAQLAEPDRFHSLVVWNTNPLASDPDQNVLRTALSREDLFTVVVDCFQTDTADYADIVLPAASFLEFDDLTFSYFHLHMGVQAQAREPMGESLPNQEIFRRLAKAMAFAETELYETDEQLIQGMIGEMSLDSDFAELKDKGWFAIGAEPIILYDDLKFNTPSGRIEIASAQAEEMGLPRLPRLPQPIVDNRPAQGRLRLLTPASLWRMNDSYANDPAINDRAGAASVILHPDDADRLNIKSGDRVSLHNETGAIELIAEIDQLTPAGVALSYKGRWPKLEDNNNLNVLHRPQKSDMGESTAVHSTEVTITPVS